MGYKDFYFLGFTLLINLTGYNALDGEAIIGGEDAKVNEYLYTVSLQDVGDGRENICSGGIIDEYHVITAAHCVASRSGEFFGRPLLVVGGTNDLNSISPRTRQIYVEKVFISNRFHSDPFGQVGDIAVLRLSEAISIGQNTYLRLPDANRNHDGLMATVTGFGWNEIRCYGDLQEGTFEEEGLSFGKMRVARTQILTRTECLNFGIFPFPRAVMCARMEANKQKHHRVGGACSGDSGAPLVINGELVGVVNNSPPGCNEDVFPSKYARITSYLTFIQNAINDQSSPALTSFVLPSHVKPGQPHHMIANRPC